MMPSRLPRVLIAEDDYLVSEMVKGLLSEMGYAVAGVASTGQEALSMTQQLQPDVVLMDIRMPDMDGIEATRLITQRYPTPVVMLTAYETPELVQASSEAGAGAFLVKPPNAAEIQRTVTIAMARCADLRKLRVLNAELQARNEELDAFAHTVAHDLKDLLARIVGFAEAVVDNLGTLAPHELETHLRTISQGGRKMGEIIDALLLLAGVHKIEVAVAPLNMAGIVASALQRLDSLVSERQATIVVPDLWPTAMGYEPWVEEVWYNYISNAVKYSGDPAQIELGATVMDDGPVCFWVRDNGAGIPPEQQAVLFTPFARIGQSHSNGYGLGLSIVRRIVERLGGEVSAQSCPDGSTFSFTLPVST